MLQLGPFLDYAQSDVQNGHERFSRLGSMVTALAACCGCNHCIVYVLAALLRVQPLYHVCKAGVECNAFLQAPNRDTPRWLHRTTTHSQESFEEIFKYVFS